MNSQLPVLDLNTLNEKDRQSLLVETFQGPGCSTGFDTTGSCYSPNADATHSCNNHSAGTFVGGIGNINLGLPKGFNRLGPIDKTQQRSNIRIHFELPEYLSTKP